MADQTQSSSPYALDLNNTTVGYQDPLAAATIIWQRQTLPVGKLDDGKVALPDPIGAVRRLVVLVPDQGLDQPRLLAALRALSHDSDADVLFLGLFQDDDMQASYFLDVVRLSTVARESGMRARAHQVRANGWMPALAQFTRPGDLIVAYPDLSGQHGLRSYAGGGLVADQVTAPVCILSNVYTPALPQKTQLLIGALIWIVPLVFLFVQWEIIRSITGTLQTAVLVLTVLVEFGLILALDLLRKR